MNSLLDRPPLPATPGLTETDQAFASIINRLNSHFDPLSEIHILPQPDQVRLYTFEDAVHATSICNSRSGPDTTAQYSYVPAYPQMPTPSPVHEDYQPTIYPIRPDDPQAEDRMDARYAAFMQGHDASAADIRPGRHRRESHRVRSFARRLGAVCMTAVAAFPLIDFFALQAH